MLQDQDVIVLIIAVGSCGIDRCVLARGNYCGICAGILKALSCGGLGIWYCIDIALIACRALHDGFGKPLSYNF
jgi:hypothetical protein